MAEASRGRETRLDRGHILSANLPHPALLGPGASQPHRSPSGSRMLSGGKAPTFPLALRRARRPGWSAPIQKAIGGGLRYCFWILAGRGGGKLAFHFMRRVCSRVKIIRDFRD